MGRLEKLKELEARLYASMEAADTRTLAAIARQYRETIREIEEIEGGTDDGDEISEIIRKRDTDGKSGAVRPDRSRV